MSGMPITRFVAPQGALPQAPVAAPAWRPRPVGTPVTRFVAPQGGLPKAIRTTTECSQLHMAGSFAKMVLV
eukprot:1101042-Pyramimonas_sp.AAC.1